MRLEFGISEAPGRAWHHSKRRLRRDAVPNGGRVEERRRFLHNPVYSFARSVSISVGKVDA
jgi:hypothetical protein